jgi:N-acetyl-D-muramate 6-phosphate phosphatase
MKVDAILWDYDGTLVNSVPKNIAITKQIISIVAPRLTGSQLPKYLITEEEYHRANHQSKNWQDLYINYYGMTEIEMLRGGELWTEYQLKNTTPVELFPGIKETINQISLPQGICSQNSSKNIKQVLEKYNLSHKFDSIIGYDDIPVNMQKPSPYSGIKCLSQTFKTLTNKTIFYIGDHEGDVEFASNLEKELKKNNKIISILVKYSGAETNSWKCKPDFELESPKDLLNIVTTVNSH